VRGWVRVRAYSDPPEALLLQSRWVLRPPEGSAASPAQSRALLQGRRSGNALCAQLEGIVDRDGAAALRGWQVLIERAKLPPPAAREHYHADLLGFVVRNTRGVLLGTLQQILAAPAAPVMLVRGEREHAVPAAPPHLRRVDLQRREIEVDWPEDF
jgi:16S rRNA processing protein RimM